MKTLAGMLCLVLLFTAPVAGQSAEGLANTSQSRSGPEFGACCLSGVVCLPAADESECDGFGGVFLPGEDCADSPCDTGACCVGDNCVHTDAYTCIFNGRDFYGAGSSCLDDPCESGVGACCLGTTCTDTDPDSCAASGGIWLGAGTNCGQGPCEGGSCCFGEKCDETLRRFECDAGGGLFFEGQACEKGPCSEPEECPGLPLFSQHRDLPDDFLASTSEQAAGFIRYDDFQGVAGAIEGVHFWGLDLFFNGSVWLECTESDPTFQISFHADAGGAPGEVVCSHELTATRTPTGIFYLGSELNEYHVDLPEPCILVHGWISITGLGDEDCWFLWMSAGLGGSWCDGCSTSQQDVDLTFCLLGDEGGITGACCNDADASCSDGVDIADCTDIGTRFLPGGSCEDLSPPCGITPGACCFPDATCSILEFEDCETGGGTWLGAFTTCAQCPCITACPDGGDAEGEPMCADGYVDLYNGGCSGATFAVQPISLGSTICGNSGVFNLDGENIGDWDWYEVTLTEQQEVTWTVTAEFPFASFIGDGNISCPSDAVASGSGLECDEVILQTTLEPGTWWFIVTPIAATDTAACGARYTATLQSSGQCSADLNDDGNVDTNDLLAMLVSWGDCTECPADINNDGTVDTLDLITLLGMWGPCPR